MRSKIKLSVYLIIACLLAACATVPASEAPSHYVPYHTRQLQLQRYQNFHLSGAMIIKTPELAQSMSLSWQQVADHYQIFLFGPLGLGTVKIEGGVTGVTLTDSQGKIYHAKTPENLMQQLLGWQLPVSAGIYWVRGLAAPAMKAEYYLDAAGHLAELHQAGWTIHYLQYTHAAGIDLPSVIVLKYHTLFIKVVISRWS